MNVLSLAGVGLLAFVACGRSPESPPSGPTPPGPSVDVSGAWSGRYEEMKCGGPCLQCCSMRFKSGAPQRDFTLELIQQGPAVSGSFREAPLPNIESLAGSVSGLVSGYRLTLAGTLSWFSPVFADLFGITDLRDFDATLDIDGGMTGAFVLLTTALDGSVSMRRECEILRLIRVQHS